MRLHVPIGYPSPRLMSDKHIDFWLTETRRTLRGEKREPAAEQFFRCLDAEKRRRSNVGQLEAEYSLWDLIKTWWRAKR